MSAGPALAQDDLLAFLGGQGCTIGPESRAAAQAAGIDPVSLDTLAAATVMTGAAKAQDRWTVLDADICTIRLPEIVSPVRLTDPDIDASISDPGAYAEFDEPGCFLVGPYEVLRARETMSDDDAFHAYITLIGKGIVDGDLAFYSPDVLRTPPGFQVLTADCGTAPGAEAVIANQAKIAELFDPYIRAVGAEQDCSSPTLPSGSGVKGRPIGGTNAWAWFEFDMITFAAGWYDGMTAKEKGRPRPPLCHW